ncbi:Serine/threonine-protein kinase PDK1 [Frankliniella fusca]|uniref:Serine/threonine-protein kinase PDK1 n=1 Tax=Frankliniella fusca TaxID=407009 RepID=A0AAE1I2X4_9NEOP|nr:Serine/threonine-protein kinase PDK1 [Frankliniella fusca]
MPLVTVSTPERGERIFVMGDTIEALRQSAIKAFNLPVGESYEVCRESDGVKILTDEVLHFLSNSESNGKNLEVLLSPSSTAQSECAQTTPTSTVSNVLGNIGNSNSQASYPPLPMRNIVEILNPILEVALNPDDGQVTPLQYFQMKKVAIRETYQEISKFIRKKAKSYSFPTAKHYAQLVLSYDSGKFSRLFEVKVGSTVKSGLSAFTLQIYNNLNYRKTEKKTRRPRRRLLETQSEEDVDDVVPLPSEITSASYGCAAYAATLPPDETEESQEKSRIDLLSMDPDSTEASVLMERTYPTQRAVINQRKVKDVFIMWPLLKHRTHLCSHADRLLGKDVRNVWSHNLGNKCGRFNDYMLAHFASENKKKSTTITRSMLSLLKEKDQVDGILQQEQANSLALFPLLVGYNKEDSNLLFRVMPATTTTEELKEIDCQLPVLIIRGESLFDPLASTDLIVGNERVSTVNAIDGFLLVFLSYFVFGLQYPKNLSSSLEFIQRLLLDINPEVGSKKERTPRDANYIDAKVRQLTEQLTFHCSAWNVCRF